MHLTARINIKECEIVRARFPPYAAHPSLEKYEMRADGMQRVISTGKWAFTPLPVSLLLIAILGGGKTEKCAADIPSGGWALTVLVFDVAATSEVLAVAVNSL